MFFDEIKEVDIFVQKFCRELESGSYITAEGYMHPKTDLTVGNFSTYITKIAQECGFKFSDGVDFKYRASTNASLYTIEYDGMVYDVVYRTECGGKSFDFCFTVVDNDFGYGIYEMSVCTLFE